MQAKAKLLERAASHVVQRVFLRAGMTAACGRIVDIMNVLCIAVRFKVVLARLEADSR
jgi:hypothetical protein